ncbi:MAG TPA: DUF167 domain-containing protein [Patescibacteria group bacterium]|jgi:hypothetical protein|nr:DUF167 domain-containing protein [Patescibacteria group bacterium]
MPRVIRVKVHTHASFENVEEVGIDEYNVWITAIPEHGRANEDLIDLLAEYFDVAPTLIRIRSGSKSTHKLIEIP